MSVLVREIRVSGSSYFLRVDWSGRGLESGFLLLLTDGRDAWRGEVGVAELSSEAEELEMETERYVQDLQQALTGTRSSAPSPSGSAPSGSGSASSDCSSAPYSFTLTPAPPPSGAAVTLAYEKVQREISFRLGSVLLDPVLDPVQTVRLVLVHSLHRATDLEQENLRLEEENRRLEGEHRRIAQQLRRYAEGKEALEEELYSRFVLVLNQKKEKIRSLQENLNLATQQNSSGKKEVKGGQEEEEEGEDYGGSTDEEEQTTSSSSRAGQCPESPLDDSLKDLTDVAPCRKRRHRHLEAPGPALKRPNPPGEPKTRTNPPGEPKTRTRRAPPPGPSRTPHQGPADAADAEDLFEDF